MNVIEPRKISAFKRNMAVPKLKPDSPPRLIVPEIELLSRFHVKFAEKSAQRARICRRRGNEMIMVREHRPSS